MTDKENIKIGDVCTYSYDNRNKSLSIVEVVKELSDKVVEVKFHQVIVDDSGNDYFTYLLKSGYTMNVSRKYLHRIELIAKQQAEIENLKDMVSQNEGVLPRYEQLIRADAIKEFTKKLKELPVPYHSDIDRIAEEMAGAHND